MNKQIAVERIYSLGDYQNIKFSDTIVDIPDVIASSPEAMRLLRYLQLVDLEWSYLHYQEIRLKEPKITSPDTMEQAMNFIESERTTTFENLLSIMREELKKKE